MKTIKLFFAVMMVATVALSCKKSTKQPADPAPTSGGGGVDSVQYTITVSSNYLRSYVGVDNLTDNKEIKRFNVNGDVTNCPITYTFWVRSDKHYYVNTYSSKNSADSTLYMADQGRVWNKLVVMRGSQIVYNKKDSINWPVAINNHHINQ